MKEKIKYLTDRYDELMWQAQHVEPLKELNIWGRPYDETWGHVRNSFRGEDGAPYEVPDIAAHVHFSQWRPEYVLAHIAALRAVLALHEPELEREISKPAVTRISPDVMGAWIMKKDIIDALLQPFSNRADFQEEWRA